MRHQQRSQPRQQSFSRPISNTPVPLPPTKQVQLEDRSGSEKPFDTQEQPETDKLAQYDYSSTQDLPKYAGKSTIPNVVSFELVDFIKWASGLF